ncbi:MAG: MazG-like family protein [Clostridiales bacterium]|nr:MazG-like family protein [Clostridiales bacterium]MCF8022493.1 MazG-like family protein [Clostridiales bacterium]
MFPANKEPGIARNIKVVEWLKADFLASVSSLFKSMLHGSEEKLVDALASMVLTCYVLGRRLGITFSRLDLRVEAKLRQGIEENHEVEEWYNDLSSLLNYMVERKR